MNLLLNPWISVCSLIINIIAVILGIWTYYKYIKIEREVTWEDYYRGAFRIKQQIDRNNFLPDYIIAVCGGGCILGDLLSMLFRKPMLSVLVERIYEKGNLKDVLIKDDPDNGKQGINFIIKNKNILIVDDFTRSGLTLKKVSEEYIDIREPKQRNIAVLSIPIDNENLLCHIDFSAYRHSTGKIIMPYGRT